MRILSLLFLISTFTASSQNLFPFQQDGLWGYMDENEDVRIEPQFHTALSFNRGVAPVRSGGYYGYINTSGEFVAEPEFDYATPFFNADVAVVYKAETAKLIGRDFKYRDVPPFSRYFPLYDMRTGSHYPDFLCLGNDIGLPTILNEKGEVILSASDSVYAGRPSSGYIGKDKVLLYYGEQACLLDINTRTLSFLPDGFHYQPAPDVIIGTPANDPKPVYGLIFAPSGEIMDTLDLLRVNPYDMKFSEGMSIASFFDPPLSEPTNNLYHLSRRKGIYKINGESVLLNPEIEYTSAIREGVFFASEDGLEWKLYNSDGQPVNNRSYRQSISGFQGVVPFAKGLEPIIHEGFLCALYPNGHLEKIVEATGEIAEYNLSLNYVKFMGRTEQGYMSGYWNTETGYVSGLNYTSLSPAANGTIHAISAEGDHLYILPDGTEVVIPDAPIRGMRPLNTDNRIDARVVVGSPDWSPMNGFGGWAYSDNLFSDYPTDDLPEGLTVLVGDEIVPWEMNPHISGREIYLVNNTRDTAIFEAEDSRIYALIEARDESGDWRAVQNYRHSWCGNSYHHVYLPPGKSWNWTIPEMEGAFETDMRIRIYNLYPSFELTEEAKKRYDTAMMIRDSLAAYADEHPNQPLPYVPESRFHFSPETDLKRPATEIVSPAFKGSINPGQFWRDEVYSPSGIMDPYY